MIDRAEQLAQELGDPYAMGWAAGAASVLAFSEGRWRACADVGDYAIALYRARCIDATWEIGTLQSWFRLRALCALGELRTLAEDALAAERESERRADLYTLTNLRLGVVPYLRLAQNDPEGARVLVDDTIHAWSRRGWPYLAAACAVSGSPTSGVQTTEACSTSLRYRILPAEKSANRISSSGQLSLTPPLVVSDTTPSARRVLTAFARRPVRLCTVHAGSGCGFWSARK